MATWDLASARAAGNLHDWIVAYLSVPEWENLGLLRRVRAYATVWEGPRRVALSDLVRIAGPGETFAFPQDPVAWQRSIDAMIQHGVIPEALPPMILWRIEGGLNVADGNHRLDALRQSGFDEAWAIISPYPLREGAREAWLAAEGRFER